MPKNYQKKVAVVIPIFNRSASIAACIASVQEQTHAVDKIIVIDDASTDNTLNVVKQLSASDGRIVVLALTKRKGAAAARNVGIAHAEAKWICFLDSDDLWLPDKLRPQLALLSRSRGCVASFTGQTLVSGNDRQDKRLGAFVDLDELRSGNLLGSTSSAVVAREALLCVGGFDEGLPSCQDWDLWLKLFPLGGFCLVSDSLVEVFTSSKDRISRDIDAVLHGHAIVFERALAEVFDKTVRKRIEFHHNKRLADVYYYENFDPIESLRYAVRALKISPNREGVSVAYRGLRSLISCRYLRDLITANRRDGG